MLLKFNPAALGLMGSSVAGVLLLGGIVAWGSTGSTAIEATQICRRPRRSAQLWSSIDPRRHCITSSLRLSLSWSRVTVRNSLESKVTSRSLIESRSLSGLPAQGLPR